MTMKYVGTASIARRLASLGIDNLTCEAITLITTCRAAHLALSLRIGAAQTSRSIEGPVPSEAYWSRTFPLSEGDCADL